jgi:hypothetical protein
MMGPEADDDSRTKVRQFLDGNGLEKVPVTSAATT